MLNVLRVYHLVLKIVKILSILRTRLLIMLHINHLASILFNNKCCPRNPSIIYSNEIVKTFRIESSDRIRSNHNGSKHLNFDEGGQCCTWSNAEMKCMPGPLAKFIKKFYKLFRLVITQVGLKCHHDEHMDQTIPPK